MASQPGGIETVRPFSRAPAGARSAFLRAHPGARRDAVIESQRSNPLHVSCAAPSALKSIFIPNPGLTAGPMHCRLFEASLAVIGSLLLRSNGK
jgi:hypothetical protein